MKKSHFYLLALVVLIAGVAWWLMYRSGATSPAGPTLTLLYNAEEQPGEKSLLSQVIKSQLNKAGIDVTLQPVPSTVYNDRTEKGDFQAVLSLWFLDYDDAEGFLTDFYSKAGYRLSKYGRAEYDLVYQEALFAPTEAEKRSKYLECARMLDAELPWIPLFSNNELFLIKPEAEGFRANAYQYYDYRRVALPTIRAFSDVEVQTFDPAMTYDLASKHLVTQSYEGLIGMDDKNQIVPMLSESWQFSNDGTSLSFNLRPNVRFHKASFLAAGEPRVVDAGDVKASFERLIKAGSPYGYIFDHVTGVEAFKEGKAAGVEGFVAESPLRFAIKLKKPFPTMLPWLLAPAAYVTPQEMPEKYDFAKGSCGTGAFVMTSWNGVEAKFAANPDYWGQDGGKPLPLAQSLSIRIIKDASIALAALQRGELDIFNVPLPLYDAILDSSGSIRGPWRRHKFREVKLNNLKFIGINMASEPWGGDAALRKRISDALNRDEIVQQLFRGKARAARSIIPGGVSGLQP